MVLAEGAEKHEAWNWLDIPIDDHLNHAVAHILGYLSGDRSENHLAHAACRVHFASELEERVVDLPAPTRGSDFIPEDWVSDILKIIKYSPTPKFDVSRYEAADAHYRRLAGLASSNRWDKSVTHDHPWDGRNIGSHTHSSGTVQHGDLQ